MATAATSIDVFGVGVGQPAEHLFLITPSDTAQLRYVTRGIRVGTAGDLAVLTVSGETVTIPDVLAGETLAIRAVKVFATNTTADGIMGLA